jgi:hypothetical protein
MQLDLTEALQAAQVRAAQLGYGAVDDRILFAYGRVAIPIIERQVREKVAQEIKDFAKEAAKTDSPDAILGLITASHIASGQKASSFDQLADELDAAIARGDAAGNETTGGDR